MCVLSEPILKLLYEDQSAITAAPLLSVLSIGVIFISLLAITNSILQASNNEKYPIYSMLCGAAVKLVSSYFLIGNPDINIMGAPVGTLFCYIAAAGINFIFVSKSVNIVPSFGKVFFRPFIASVLCAATGLGAYNILSSAFGESGFFTLAAIGASGLVYIIAIFLIQAVDREDLMLLPKGKKICALFERLHLLKA